MAAQLEWPRFRDEALSKLVSLQATIDQGKVEAAVCRRGHREHELERELKIAQVMCGGLEAEVDSLVLERDEGRRAAEAWRKDARKLREFSSVNTPRLDDRHQVRACAGALPESVQFAEACPFVAGRAGPHGSRDCAAPS